MNRRDEAKALGQHRCDLDVRQRRWILQDRQIDVAMQQPLLEIGAVALTDIQRHVRPARAKRQSKRRHQWCARLRRHSKTDRTRHRLGRSVIQRRRKQPQDGVEPVAQAGARRGQRHAAPVTQQKWGAESLLKLAELQRNGRLAEVQIARRTAKVAGLRNAEEIAEFAQPERLLTRLALSRGGIGEDGKRDGIHPLAPPWPHARGTRPPTPRRRGQPQGKGSGSSAASGSREARWMMTGRCAVGCRGIYRHKARSPLPRPPLPQGAGRTTRHRIGVSVPAASLGRPRNGPRPRGCGSRASPSRAPCRSRRS